MTSEKTGSNNNHLNAMKEYLGVGEYAVFIKCIKEQIGPTLSQNQKYKGNDHDNDNNNNNDYNGGSS